MSKDPWMQAAAEQARAEMTERNAAELETELAETTQAQESTRASAERHRKEGAKCRVELEHRRFALAHVVKNVEQKIERVKTELRAPAEHVENTKRKIAEAGIREQEAGAALDTLTAKRKELEKKTAKARKAADQAHSDAEKARTRAMG